MKHKENIHDLSDNLDKTKHLSKGINEIGDVVHQKKPLVIKSNKEKKAVLEGINGVERALDKVRSSK